MNRIRCFLALHFSVGVTRKIVEEVERQRKLLPAGTQVSWVPPANLHVTLRFLGSIDESLLDGLEVRLKRLAPRHPPFEARVRGLGAFPDVEHPNVLWAGVESDALQKLQRDVEAMVVELGFAKEERPYHPHVTVGRVRESGPLLEWNSTAELGASALSEIVVYESRAAAKSGVEYVARARVALGKGD